MDVMVLDWDGTSTFFLADPFKAPRFFGACDESQSFEGVWMFGPCSSCLGVPLLLVLRHRCPILLHREQPPLPAIVRRWDYHLF